MEDKLLLSWKMRCATCLEFRGAQGHRAFGGEVERGLEQLVSGMSLVGVEESMALCLSGSQLQEAFLLT